MAVPQIFDRARRRARRDRAQHMPADRRFLVERIEDELLDRLDDVSRRFGRALVVGAYDGRLAAALRARGLDVTARDAGPRFAAALGAAAVDEDALDIGPGGFDLVLSPAVLDQVADLPGALALIRRTLTPDGLFLAGFVGAGSLPRLRSALLAADAADGRAVARLHPQIDLRTAGDLLQRAGFTLPVADGARLTVRYRTLAALVADLRAMAATNLLAGPVHPLGRAALARAVAAFEAAADPDGRVPELFELVFLTAWSPSPDQPSPARRGSATASLADALKPRN